MTNRSKVLILVPNGIEGKGGIERLMLYLSKTLPDCAPDVAFDVHATRLVTPSPWNHLSTPLSLLWFVLRVLVGRYDVLHCNIAPRGSTWRKRLFVKVAQIFGLRVLIHLHGSGYDAFYAAQPAAKQARIKALFQSADHVVVLGKYWHDFAKTTLGLADEKLSAINNGAPDTDGRADPANAPCKIAFAGLIGERKGVDVLVDALASLPSDLTWRAEIGGNGEVETYQTRAKDRGIADRVHFSGWLGEAEVDALLLSSQIFVLPSRAENQPMSIIEAMARGLPVISTKIGAIPEQIEDGTTGIIVAPGNVEALARALETLIRNPQTRVTMGQAGRARYAERYSMRANAEAFSALYRDLAAQK